jgi:hypothetical protein
VTDTRDIVESAAINLAHALFARLVDIENFAVTTASELRSEILASATLHVRNLHQRTGDDANLGSARVVCRALYGSGEPPATWWRTKLGGDVAWAIGYPTPTASPSATADVLGCSRSYVSRLIREGALITDPDNGRIWSDTIRLYARRPAAANRGGSRD